MAFSSHIIKAVCFVVLLSAIAYQIQAQSSSNASSSSSENGGGPKSSSSGGKKGKKGASSSGNEQASFDYSVLHARAGPGDSDDNSTYFCVIDVLANSSRPFDKDFLPLKNFTHYSLCSGADSLGAMVDNGEGYYVFNHSLACSSKAQIDRFEERFPHSRGIIFSTSCDLNLRTHFNFSSEFIAQKKFRLSVINGGPAARLLTFKQVQGVESEVSNSSALACMLLIFTTACCCVFVGAYWSGRVRYRFYLESVNRSTRNSLIGKDGSGRSKSAEKNGQNGSSGGETAFAELTLGSVIFAVVITITVLLALYFFYRYIVYFFIVIFMIFSAISFFACFYEAAEWLLPERLLDLSFAPCGCMSSSSLKRFTLPYVCLPLVPLAIGLPVTWFAVRHTSPHAWLLQDILCITFCVYQLRTLRLPSFKICFMLLSALFIYDIFFVFITPLFTSTGVSIMEYVATGGVSNRGSPLEYRCTGEQAEVLPLSIRVPRNVLGAQPQHSFDYCVTGSYSLLGLGDIIIPGIMVAYCAAFDRIRAVRYHQYFAAASVGYAAGLMLSYVALITMQIAQPALLYLVPTTTISVLLVALIRKEVRPFWMGPEAAAAALIDSGLKPIAAGEDTSSAESS